MRAIRTRSTFDIPDQRFLSEFEILTRTPYSVEAERNTENNDGVLTVDEMTKKLLIKYNNKELVLVSENNEIIFKERERSK